MTREDPLRQAILSQVQLQLNGRRIELQQLKQGPQRALLAQLQQWYASVGPDLARRMVYQVLAQTLGS
jgi:hypothetical protein